MIAKVDMQKLEYPTCTKYILLMLSTQNLGTCVQTLSSKKLYLTLVYQCTYMYRCTDGQIFPKVQLCSSSSVSDSLMDKFFAKV